LVKTVLAELRKSKKLIADQHRLYKAPVLEYGQRLDKIKREATPRVQALLDAWKKARDEYDAEQERIAQEKAQKEAERVGKIESRIDEIRNLPTDMIGESSAAIEGELAALEHVVEDFQEFAEAGNTAKKKTLNLLSELLRQAKTKEERGRGS
jgi:predicted Holliday junction resolvase-like endonuclease